MRARSRAFFVASFVCTLALLMFSATVTAAPQPPFTPQALPNAEAPAGSLGIFVNYSHDWVIAGGLPLAPIEITAKRAGVTIATVSGQADVDGIFRSHDMTWTPSHPDIEVGDVVEAVSNGAQAAVNPVGEIAGALNPGLSGVSGVIHAAHLAPAKLTVKCEIWVENAQVSPIVVPNVPADGGAFTCDFSSQGYQLPPGRDLAVIYFEPDGDSVAAVFRAPAPDLQAELWPEGSQSAQPGGLSVFHMIYRNQGDAPAQNVTLTNTLAPGTSFVSATLGVTPVVSAGSVEWSLGTLAPGDSVHFFLVLRNSLAAGASFENVLDISTTSEGDEPSNNHAAATIQVTDGQPDVNVGQSTQPGDVLIGDTYRVMVNYGNNGPVPGGPVRLHVQLDPRVVAQEWTSENGYDSFWTLTSNVDGHLIFDAAALPGWFGDRLLLTISISESVPADVELVSVVTIELADDPNLENNGPYQQSVWTTAQERPDLRIEKYWSYGQLIPGGRAVYRLEYGNDGNLSQEHVLLTDILPAGVTFVTSTVDADWGLSDPVTPVAQTDGKLTWDLGKVQPAHWGHINVELALSDIAAGATFTNRAEIQGLDRDWSWWNNHSTAVETVNSAGPNLRLRMDSDWESHEQVVFRLQFENVGTTTVNDVTITDTLPEGLEFNGDWWPNWWRDMDIAYDSDTRQITFHTSSLEPNWAGTVNFRAVVAPPNAGKQGLAFENAAQITVPAGEVTPEDNHVTHMVFTGPDLFVDKSLWAGKLAAGEVITFSIILGNNNDGPWHTGEPPHDSPAIYLTDTLPAGMTFLQMGAGPDPWLPWKQEGNVVTWILDNVCAGCKWQMLMTVRLAADLPAGALLTNTMEISNAIPGDVDPVPANNVAIWQGRMAFKKLFLPMLRR